MFGKTEALLVDVIEDAHDTPGAIEFGHAMADLARPWGLHFICPCGCGTEGWLPFRPAPSPSWDWDGNLEKPTLTPSVFNSGLPCKWHGWLRAGVWESC